MAPHRVRVDALAAQMTLGPREARHLHVLRLRVGDEVRVFDGQGQEAAATLTAPARPWRAAYSSLTRSTAAAPSEVAQMSSRCSGSETMALLSTSEAATSLR